LSARDKRIRDQLSYLRQIRFAEFAPELSRTLWAEYNYLLRFLGSKSEADQMMKAWEDLKASTPKP
jgi:hypothetical protein